MKEKQYYIPFIVYPGETIVGGTDFVSSTETMAGVDRVGWLI